MASTELKRADFLAAAQRWRSLARNYEISERLSQFNAGSRLPQQLGPGTRAGLIISGKHAVGGAAETREQPDSSRCVWPLCSTLSSAERNSHRLLRVVTNSMWLLAARAQQPMAVIGFMYSGSPEALTHRLTAFRNATEQGICKAVAPMPIG
jgi:hypothetical protein